MSYLRYLCLFAYSGVQHILLCFCFVCFRLVFHMLPVYLDISFLIGPSSCVPYVTSFSGFFIFDWPFGIL